MTKTHKAVLSTLAVLCLLFMGSGVAQAQECIARAKDVGMVRAEGITEVVADIELRCAAAAAGTSLAFDEIPGTLDIAVELNTPITNEIDEMRVVTVMFPIDMENVALGYTDKGIDLVGRKLAETSRRPDDGAVIADVNFQVGKLSDDGRTITWEGVPTGSEVLDPPVHTDADINLGINDRPGGLQPDYKGHPGERFHSGRRRGYRGQCHVKRNAG